MLVSMMVRRIESSRLFAILSENIKLVGSIPVFKDSRLLGLRF
jgi:hypothetical protein